jgi:hypothetical protein
MDKLDRLVWADGMSFVSYGVRVGVRVNDSAILEEISARLPPEWKPISATIVDHLYSMIGGSAKPEAKVRRLNLAYWNLLRIARSRNFDDVLDLFESHVQLTVAEHAPRRVFVHAGVVGWNDRAILIPGLSHSGKTTLVNQLVRAGATYYSDEYAVIDPRGRVHPYPRPLGIRSNESDKAERVRAEEIGGEVGTKPLRVGLVLSTSYKKGVRFHPRHISRGKGVLELLANTVSARTQPRSALEALPKALESARILKGARGEAGETVHSILKLVESVSRG